MIEVKGKNLSMSCLGVDNTDSLSPCEIVGIFCVS